MDRGRIDGAYLLLKRFKARLKLFDKALERLYEDKSSKVELQELTRSLDPNRTEVIFKDMKKCFETSLAQALQRLDHHRQKEQIRYEELLEN